MGLWGILRLILIGLCAWFIYRFVRNWMLNAGSGQRPRQQTQARQGTTEFIEELVQDPQCQTYLPKSDALRARIAGEEFYFCSEKCRDDYLNRRGK